MVYDNEFTSVSYSYLCKKSCMRLLKTLCKGFKTSYSRNNWFEYIISYIRIFKAAIIYSNDKYMFINF